MLSRSRSWLFFSQALSSSHSNNNNNNNNKERAISTFKEAFIKWLQVLNENPQIIYSQDFYTVYPDGDFESAVQSLQTELSAHGITAKQLIHYEYKGNDPAAALDVLMSRKVLFLDCLGALVLCQHLALRDTVGKARYNQIISPICQKRDLVGGVCLPFYDTVLYPQQHHAPMTHYLQEGEVELGDIVYFMGPENAFAFHPASEVNAFNVVALGSGKYLGFHSVAKEPKTQTQYQQLMHDAYSKPLSALDCYMILKAQDISLMRSYKHLTSDELKQMLDVGRMLPYAMEVFDYSSSRRPTKTSIHIPAPYDQALDIGCVSKSMINPSKFDAFLSGYKQETDHVIRYDFSKMSPPRSTHQLSFSRQSLGPHQDKIIAELNAFYEHCLNTRVKQQPGGLFLFGPAGTGKTAFCTEAMAQLEREGFRVWKKLPEDKLLSSAQEIQALDLSMRNEKHAEIDYIIQQFQSVWETSDILYVDDVNEAMVTDFHSLIAQAAYEYAITHRKQIIITGNRNFLALQDNPPFMVHVRVAEILGADYRLEVMPWKNATRVAQPRVILNLPQTAQQNQILFHLDTLSAMQKTAGLYVMGPPGMGKSTVIEAFLRGKSVVRVLRDGPVPNISDIKNNDYIFIEDIKDRMYLKSQFYDFIRQVIEHDWEGMNVKIIMTSNNLKLDQLLDDYLFKGGATGLHFSGERLSSRAHALFKELHFGPTIDFRATHADANIQARIVYQKDHANFSTDTDSVLKMSVFNRTLRAYSSKEQWTAHAQYRQSQVDRILGGGNFTVVWDDKPDFCFVENEFALMLMEMERGKLNLTVVLPDELSADAWKKSLMNSDFGPEHVSRLQRLNLQQNDNALTLKKRVYQ